MDPAALDTQDLFVLPADAPAWIVDDAIRVKGRSSPFVFKREFTARGVIIASDRERHQVYALRWSGFEAGGASELGGLALDRAQSAAEFRAALARWKMPARRVTYSETGGDRLFQDAARVPIRKGDDWAGWKTLDDLPHGPAPAATDATSLQRVGGPDQKPGTSAPIVFSHVLATNDALRQRLNVGPMVSAKPLERYPVLPGQSESPSSAHFSDLARLWSTAQELPLAYTEDAIRANAEATLTLVPKK
jgi:acyl-homoserine lactone acylase PvdQ